MLRVERINNGTTNHCTATATGCARSSLRLPQRVNSALCGRARFLGSAAEQTRETANDIKVQNGSIVRAGNYKVRSISTVLTSKQMAAKQTKHEYASLN
jgi:hypothetical protein